MGSLLQVCECVVILKNLKDVSWGGAKSMMTDPGFLKSLVEFDKDGLTEKQVKRVKTEYMKDPGFTYENIKNISTAGAGGSKAEQHCGWLWQQLLGARLLAAGCVLSLLSHSTHKDTCRVLA